MDGWNTSFLLGWPISGAVLVSGRVQYHSACFFPSSQLSPSKKSRPHHNSLRLNSSSTAFLRMELCTTAMWNHNPSSFGTDIKLVKGRWRKKNARQYIPGPPFGVFWVLTKNMTQARSREHNKKATPKHKNTTPKLKNVTPKCLS